MPEAMRCPEFVVADLLTLAPEYYHRFPDLPRGASIGSAAEQERLFESMAVLLATLSQEAPVLVVVEDAQWADSGTLTMLRYLTQQTRQRRILFLWTLRDVESAEAPTLQEVLLDFRRGQVALSIRLERLDRRSSEAMLRALFDGPVAPQVVDEVHRVTDGNPFFIEEVCKGLAESGRLKQTQGHWQLAGRKEFSVPQNLRVALQSRVQAMPAATQHALEVAAVRGAEFELEVICRAGGLDEAAAADALEAAERAEIVREISDASASLSADGGRRFTFTHSLIPAALVEDLPGPAKRDLHGRIAGALEQCAPMSSRRWPPLRAPRNRAYVRFLMQPAIGRRRCAPARSAVEVRGARIAAPAHRTEVGAARCSSWAWCTRPTSASTRRRRPTSRPSPCGRTCAQRKPRRSRRSLPSCCALRWPSR
jgi:predicted ATPase